MRDRQQQYIVVNHMFHYSLLRICIYVCMYVCIRLHPIPRKCSCNPLPKVECIMNACMVGRDTMDELQNDRTNQVSVRTYGLLRNMLCISFVFVPSLFCLSYVFFVSFCSFVVCLYLLSATTRLPQQSAVLHR